MPKMKGDELASGALGAGLEPSLGPALIGDRSVVTGMRPTEMKAKFEVPGYPQDMMEMHGMMTPEQMKKVSVPLTRGMRRNWPMGVMAMMTVLRVLPDELYEKVVSGEGHVEPGASVPGGGAGKEMGGHEGHQMENMPENEGHSGHAGHDMPQEKARSKQDGAHNHE
jgi:hypothetical protein